jgi:hypothetical protein
MVARSAGCPGDRNARRACIVLVFLASPCSQRQDGTGGSLLALGAAAGFDAALAHPIHERRYRSRTLAFFLLLRPCCLPYTRLLGFLFRLRLSPRLSAPKLKIERTGAWIELPGANMDLPLPLAEQGRLPFLGSFLEQGTAARLPAWAPRCPRRHVGRCGPGFYRSPCCQATSGCREVHPPR